MKMETNYGQARKPVPTRSPGQVWRSLIRLVVFLVFTVALWWLAAGLIVPFVDTIVASAVSLAVAVLITTAIMMRLYEMRPFYTVGFFANRTGAVHLCVGLALGSGSSLTIIGTQWALGWAHMERVPVESGWTGSVAFGFLILLVGAAGEELLFRGYAFQHLIRAFGPWFSITSTSALFAWAHTANPSFTRVGMINTALFGVVFGYAYWRTRDLWLPLGMHFAWNFSLATVGANVSGLRIKLMGTSVVSVGPVLWTGGDYGPEASLLATIVLVVTAIFLWRVRLVQQVQGLLTAEEVTHEAIGP